MQKISFSRNYTRSRIILTLLVLCFSFSFLNAQDEKVYSITPDGRTYYERSDEKILIKFQDNVSFEVIQSLLKRENLLKPIVADQVLPSPKNMVLVNLTRPVSEVELKALFGRLNQSPDVVYSNRFLKFSDGTLQGITDRVAVKLLNAGDLGKLKELVSRNGLKMLETNKYDPLVHFIRIPKNTVDPLTFANQLAESGQFAWAEVDFLRLMKRFTNDQFQPYQWSLDNTGSSIQFSGTPGADMKIFSAWGISTGSSNIKVAIIDEGVDLVHPDLAGNMLAGFDATGLGSGGAPSGNDAHGTNCAGIVAAVGNNSIGIAGVAYNCKIVPVRIAYGSGSNWITSNSWIGTALDWAWSTGNADVLSNSWGGGSSSALINDPITRATTQGRANKGAPVLFAAGNDNGAVSYPATLTNVISVTAMSMCNQRKSPSSCDGETFWGSNYGVNGDISAPGVKIYSTDISGAAGYGTGDYYATFNGTSSATPNAAGVMALILSTNSNLTAAQARVIIESTCDKVGGYTYNSGVSGQPNGTWSNDLGYGRINALTALQLANPQPCTTPAVATVLASPASVCGSGNVGLSLTGITTGTGQTYQWQSSPNNSTWTNISGQTASTASVSVSTSTWYRCQVTCGTTVASNSTQVLVNNPTISTFPHTQNFDAASTLPCGWTVVNSNADAKTWNMGTLTPRSAPNNVAYSYNTAAAANDWLFTPPLSLTAGQSYRIRFWYRARSASYVEKLELKYGAAATAAGMTSATIFSNTNIINTTYSEGTSSSFVAAASGIQYIGFHVFSDADKYDLYIDDVTIEVVSSCAVPTAAGTVTGPTSFVAGTATNYAYSGGNGTSLNWQLAVGAGSFADISGATASTLSLNQNPGVYQVRTRVSKSGCSDAFSNAISITVSARPGDLSSNALPAALPFTTTGTTAAGSGYGSDYSGTNAQASADVFWTFITGPCTDSVIVSSCGSGFDTYLHLLNTAGTELSFNDDNGIACTGTTASMKVAVQPNTSYFVVLEGYQTATGTFSLTISQVDNPVAAASISPNGPTIFCTGSNVILTASAGASYSWSTGATSQSITVNATGNYSVTVTNASGCQASASQSVTVNTPAAASISANGPTTFCAGSNVVLTASAGSSYNWSTGATSQSITVNATGSYSVTVTDANGCQSPASVSVTVNTPVAASISPNGATTFCTGSNVILTASAGSSYSWSTGATSQSITVNATGNYNVTVTDANGCSSSASQSVTVNTPAAASISANGPTTFCAGSNVILTASAGSSYSWSTGATSQSITVSTSGSNSVTVTDANGCSSSASQSVTVNSNPVVDAGTYGPVTTLTPAFALTGTPAGGSFSGTGVSGNSFDPASAGVGSAIITYSYNDPNGCSNSDGTTIVVTEGCAFSVGQISGPTNSCSYQGTTGGVATYTIGAVDATSYAWTLPSGSTSITGQGTNTISFKFSSTFTTGSVSVLVSGCGGSQTRSITVTKAIPAVPAAIAGPVNVCAFRGTATQATYSIAAVANAMSYTWTVPANVTLVSANGGTSINVTVAAAFTSGSITVKSVSGCGSSSTRSLALSVAVPGTPGTIAGTLKACPGDVFNYSVAAVANAATYNWVVPSGASITGGAGTNAIQVTFDAGFTAASGVISVTASNGCGTSAARTYTVSRNAPTTPGTITGTSLACPGSVLNYSIAAIANATGYIWTVPTGATVTSGAGTNAIQVTFDAGFTASGTISVAASNACGTSALKTYAVTRNNPSTPGTITGSAKACPGDVFTYSIVAVANATSYTWTVPSGATINSGAGTTSIQVAFNAGFIAGGAITVTSSNACGTSAVRSLTVARNTPATPGTISGQASGVCSGTVTYTVPNVTGMTYNWVAPANSTIVSGNGTNSVVVSFAPAFVSGTLSVNASNSCSTSANKTLSLTSKPATPAAITGLVTGACTGLVQTFSIAALPGATSYTWTVPATWTIQTGQGTTSIDVLVGAAGGSITAKGVNACGSGTAKTATATVTSCARLGAEEEVIVAADKDLELNAYPNPFNDKIQVSTKGKMNETLKLEILDITGRVLISQQIVANQTLDLSPDLASGIYYLCVTDGSDVRKSVKIVKAK